MDFRSLWRRKSFLRMKWQAHSHKRISQGVTQKKGRCYNQNNKSKRLPIQELQFQSCLSIPLLERKIYRIWGHQFKKIALATILKSCSGCQRWQPGIERLQLLYIWIYSPTQCDKTRFFSWRSQLFRAIGRTWISQISIKQNNCRFKVLQTPSST